MKIKKTEKFWIKHQGPVVSLMSRELANIVVTPILSYPSVYYRQGVFHKVRHEYVKPATISKTKEGVYFYSGHTPRIQKYCKKEGINLKVYKREDPIEIDITLPDNMEYRSFQPNLIKSALEKRVGVLTAPTGVGKTFLGLALINSVKNINEGVLWLCHTKDLMNQTAKEAAKFFGPENVGIIGDGICENSKFLTVATRQSFIKVVEELGTKYDMVLVDEVHHLNSFDGEYANILRQVFAPIRIGLTATVRKDLKSVLAMEAFIGPVVGRYTINEGIEDGYMAHPIIKLVRLPNNPSIRIHRKYSDVYEYGIVRNLNRNRLIVSMANEYNKKEKSCLIIVNMIAHGERLLNLFRKEGNNAEFVHGAFDSGSRELVRECLNKKNIKTVICTTVWKEGVNIPELDVVINAAGGKSEISTLQAVGRGLRRTSSKESLTIVDFFDPSHFYLISHFGERVCLFMDMGWL